MQERSFEHQNNLLGRMQKMENVSEERGKIQNNSSRALSIV
jgi:hypothetical protein